MVDQDTLNMVTGRLQRASNKLNEAKDYLNRALYPESISAAQECIELSIKSAFLLLGVSYSKKHEIKEQTFKELLNKVFKEFGGYEPGGYNFPRLLLLNEFWLCFYELAKYGYEQLMVPQTVLFRKEEAVLASKHADECYYAIRALQGMIS